MTTATLGRRIRLIPRVRLPRITPLRLAALGALILILFIAWMWFRSSSLVSVRQVQVTGLSGANAGAIRTDLANSAEQMTTLTVNRRKLRNAISAYPHIAGVTVATHFPHGLTIHVDEQIPVATINSGGRQVAVDSAGLLLPGQSTRGLPSLSVAPESIGNQVSTASTLAVLSVLRSAPYQILAYVKSARTTNAHGITLSLRNGPVIYFGSTGQLGLKWRAAEATLANPSSQGAAYIDVSAPHRPAAG